MSSAETFRYHRLFFVSARSIPLIVIIRRALRESVRPGTANGGTSFPNGGAQVSGRIESRGIRYVLQNCFPLIHVHSIPSTPFRVVERFVRGGNTLIRGTMEFQTCCRDAR